MDYESIGKRIQEQRKFIKRVSQEKMADDLGLYQADVSNLEKGKKGSGIGDLSRLEMIADYFSIPVESLIFGFKNSMIPYYKKKEDIRKGKATDKQLSVLSSLLSYDVSMSNLVVYQCGAYRICIISEELEKMEDIRDQSGDDDAVGFKDIRFPRYRFYTFYQDDIVSAMTVDKTSLWMNVIPHYAGQLQKIIDFQFFDTIDLFRRLNPYYVLLNFSDDKEKCLEYQEKTLERIQDLLSIGEENPVLYIETAYVLEQARNNGIFMMNLDLLDVLFPEAIIALNLEPMNDDSLNDGNTSKNLNPEDIIQVQTNGLIASKCGFTLDSDTWRRKVFDEKGTGKEIQIHKFAYLLPEKYQKRIEGEDKLVEYGRSLQDLKQFDEKDEERKPNTVAIRKETKMTLKNVKFVSDTDLPFDSMTVKDLKYRLVKESPFDAEVVHELCLEDSSTKKQYFFLMGDSDGEINVFLTENSMLDYYCKVVEKGDEEMCDLKENHSLYYDPEGSLDDLDEDEPYYNVLEFLLRCNDSDIEKTDKLIKKVIGKTVAEITE